MHSLHRPGETFFIADSLQISYTFITLKQYTNSYRGYIEYAVYTGGSLLLIVLTGCENIGD